jgi:prevent-host-death family protein
MSKQIPATDANRYFAQLVREVREEGAHFVVTSHGKPVARLIPAAESSARALAEEARASLLKHLTSQPVLNLPRWSRDSLYDRG